MKILIVAPVPPPHTGNSLPVKTLMDALAPHHEIDVINLNKKKHKAGVTSFSRVAEIVSAIRKMAQTNKQYDLIYLTVAESLAGNIRDLCLYYVSKSKLPRMIIHMLGGAAMADILNPAKKGWQFNLNKKYLSKIGAVVVEGQKQKETFSNVVDPKRIFINSNFAEDYLFVDEAQIENNFSQLGKLKILFLSNLLPGKGHMELLKAYLALPEEMKNKFNIEFAGKLVEQEGKDFFLKSVEEHEALTYHGSVSGDHKQQIYANAHVFCLPTHYPYEGQPFCIVEAYATGCCVVTSYHSGIPHIFTDNVHGYRVDNNSVEAMKDMLIRLWKEKSTLKQFAENNLILARKEYNDQRYIKRMKQVIDFVVQNEEA